MISAEAFFMVLQRRRCFFFTAIKRSGDSTRVTVDSSYNIFYVSVLVSLCQDERCTFARPFAPSSLVALLDLRYKGWMI